MAKTKKIQNVPLSQVVIHMDRNVREQTEASYDDPAMRDSLALVGQQTIAKLLRLPDGTYEPIQGNRRSFNLKKLAEAKVIDPKTAKRDPETGNILRDENGKPVGGRPFETIEAEVYEGLTERERVELLIDDGNKRMLNKVELQYALEALFNAGYTEKEVVIMAYGLLVMHYPPSRNIKNTSEDGGQDALEYFRGVVQTAKDAFRSPTMARDEWITKLKSGRAWPLKKELTQGYATFKKELDADKTGKMNRANPGPEFRKYWASVIQKHQQAEQTGEKRGKSSAMMNAQQVGDRVTTCDSRTGKAWLKAVLRQIPEDQIAVLDAACFRLEKGEITKEQFASVLDTVFASDTADTVLEEPKAPPATPEPVGAEVALVHAEDAASEDKNGGPPADIVNPDVETVQ